MCRSVPPSRQRSGHPRTHSVSTAHCGRHLCLDLVSTGSHELSAVPHDWCCAHRRDRKLWVLGSGNDKEAMPNQERPTASIRQDVERPPSQLRIMLSECVVSVEGGHGSPQPLGPIRNRRTQRLADNPPGHSRSCRSSRGKAMPCEGVKCLLSCPPFRPLSRVEALFQLEDRHTLDTPLEPEQGSRATGVGVGRAGSPASQ